MMYQPHHELDTISDTEQATKQDHVYILQIVGIVLICVILLLLLALTRQSFIRIEKYEKTGSATQLVNTEFHFDRNPYYIPHICPNVPLIQKDSVVGLQPIGEGHFSTIFKGSLVEDKTMIPIVIKVLKNATPQANEKLIQEAELMRMLQHKNVISIIGMVFDCDEHSTTWIVMEAMPYGDLSTILKSNGTSVPGLQRLTTNSLYWIALQISRGLHYLSKQMVVHRDLACRNCLVGVGLQTKIADFGMARYMYAVNDYKNDHESWPIRWMAPESLMYGQFTHKTDIWSYGIVLWEMYTYGRQPYFGFDNLEIIRLITHGKKLAMPKNCPPYIYKIMVACWDKQPQNRPRSSTIYQKLKEGGVMLNIKSSYQTPINRMPSSHQELTV